MSERLELRCLAIALFAGGLLLWGCSAKDNQAKASQRAQGAPVPVTVTNAVVADVPVQVTGIGTAHAYSTVSVKSQIKGILFRVGFQQGEQVRQGDLIFQMDPRPYEAARDQAKANLARDQALLVKANADLLRAAELLHSKIISGSDYDQIRANADALEATIAADRAAITNAEVELSYCYLKSPINGRIGTLLVNEGNVVKDLDTVLAVINQLKPIYVDFSVPEQNLPAVREHMKEGELKVEASIPGYEKSRAQGKLLLINNEVDPTTGTILLRAEFPNEDEMLWAGQFVNVALTLAVERHVVVVPLAAVQLGQQNQYVCVVKPDETVEIRPVEVGTSYGQSTVVKAGLQPGERLVTSGQLRLVAGSKVTINGNEGEAEKKRATAQIR